MLSSAWVQYVQAVKKPTTGMIYAYPVLQPQGSRADQILLTAAAAPSLEAYLATPSEREPDLRAAARHRLGGGAGERQLTPDPRLLANLDRVARFPPTGRFLLVDSGSSMLTLYQNGQPINSMKVITGHRGAADAADRQRHVLHHLQSLLARARPSGPQDDRAERAEARHELSSSRTAIT